MTLSKKIVQLIVVALIFSPVIFIDQKHSHDWGDDFAQYIHQAINITNGTPQSETGYIFNPENFIGPPAYPIGFPLMLSPVYALFGNDIHAFGTFISVMLVAMSVVFFFFYRNRLSFLVSLLLTMIIVFNPWTMKFKGEVMSDIPFTFFMFLAILGYRRSKESYWYLILCGIISGFTIHVRSIGWVLPLSFVFDYLITTVIPGFRNEEKIGVKDHLIFLGRYGLPLSFAFLALKSFFPLPGGYTRLADWENFGTVFLRHLSYNVSSIHYFFSYYDVGDWNFLSFITACSFLVLGVIGFIKKIVEQFDYLDFLFSIYLFIIVIFPYGDAGIRYLLPLIPFFMIYTVSAFKSFGMKINKKIAGICLAILVFAEYRYTFFAVVNCNCESPGPFEKESVEAFQYIKSNTPASARFLFFKPRSLALYGERSSYVNCPNDGVEAMNKKLRDNHINYILVHNELSDDSLKALVGKKPAAFIEEWENSKFSLYKVVNE